MGNARLRTRELGAPFAYLIAAQLLSSIYVTCAFAQDSIEKPNIWVRYSDEEQSWINVNSDGASIELYRCERLSSGQTSFSVAFLSQPVVDETVDRLANADYLVIPLSRSRGRSPMYRGIFSVDEYFGNALEFVARLDDVSASESMLICTIIGASTSCHRFISERLADALSDVCSRMPH